MTHLAHKGEEAEAYVRPNPPTNWMRSANNVSVENSELRLRACLLLTERQPDHPFGYIAASRIYFSTGRHNESREILEIGYPLVPGPEIPLELCLLDLLEDGLRQKYESRIMSLLQQYQGANIIWGRLMEALILDSRPKEAIDIGNAILERILKDPYLLVCYCQALNEIGDAHTSYRLLSHDPNLVNHIEILNLSLRTLYLLEQYEGVTRLFEKADQIGIANAESANIIALMYIEGRDLDKARNVLSRYERTKNLKLKELASVVELLECKYSLAFLKIRETHVLASTRMTEEAFNQFRHQIYHEVVNECNVNRFKVKDIESLYNHPYDIKMKALGNLFSDQPSYLGSSLAVLNTLRNRRKLGLNSLSFYRGQIPPLIWMYWDQGEPPDEVLRVVESWKVQNKNFHVRLLNRVSARNHLDLAGACTDLEIFDRINSIGLRSDYIRLALLTHFGGVYVDADDLCKRSIESIVSSGYEEVFAQELFGTIANNFIACKAGASTLRNALQILRKSLESEDVDRTWFIAGPQLMTRAVAESFLKENGCTSLNTSIKIMSWLEFKSFVTPHKKMLYKKEFHWSMEKLIPIKPKNENLFKFESTESALGIPCCRRNRRFAGKTFFT